MWMITVIKTPDLAALFRAAIAFAPVCRAFGAFAGVAAGVRLWTVLAF